jgi:hypothetical protein
VNEGNEGPAEKVLFFFSEHPAISGTDIGEAALKICLDDDIGLVFNKEAVLFLARAERILGSFSGGDVADCPCRIIPAVHLER